MEFQSLAVHERFCSNTKAEMKEIIQKKTQQYIRMRTKKEGKESKDTHVKNSV